MSKTLSFKVTGGIDSSLRVLTTLRRKQFSVKEFFMKELDNNNTELSVTIEDTFCEFGFEKAVLQIEKIFDVYDLSETF